MVQRNPPAVFVEGSYLLPTERTEVLREIWPVLRDDLVHISLEVAGHNSWRMAITYTQICLLRRGMPVLRLWQSLR